MENYTLESDIRVLCVEATSFPEGVMEAYDKLHSVIPKVDGRKVFGISRPEGGNSIIYKAAAEEMQPEESEKLNLETFTIRKGEYASIMIRDFMTDIPSVGRAFQEILHTQKVDPQGACIEWYLNDKDVQCMVRLVQ